jgi:hypothetical protein
MVRKMTPAQFQSYIRQQQNKQKQAIDKYNREVRQHNQNRTLAISRYHNEVRRYNQRQRTNQQKIVRELNRLQSSQRAVTFQAVRTSAILLNSSYDRLDSHQTQLEASDFGPAFLDLSEKENAISLETVNILEGEAEQERSTTSEDLRASPEVCSMLETVSPELNNRWKGALFSLNPDNPDAARHFCTSAREVFFQILDLNAPDDSVLDQIDGCEITERGHPTRREKIKYLLMRSGISGNSAVDFVDENVKNVLGLFRVFNDGTHGTSGKFSIEKLMAIKTRVEGGIAYLHSISLNA